MQEDQKTEQLLSKYATLVNCATVNDARSSAKQPTRTPLTQPVCLARTHMGGWLPTGEPYMHQWHDALSLHAGASL
jgi:hypothetical protein